MIMLDVDMPEMSGQDVIKCLKSNDIYKNIPVIFLTGKNDIESELEGLSLGAIDYIVKPFSPPLLLKRLELHLLVMDQKKELMKFNDSLQQMVALKTKTVVELQNAVLMTMAELVECRDDITGGHIERTQRYLNILIDALQKIDLYSDEVSSWDVDLLLQSAQLHDVGKISIADDILLKPGRLTAEEFETIKVHTTFGVRIIDKIKSNTTQQEFLKYARILAGTHHEKWDGTGYPNKLAGEDIPLPGRLMAIADVYDALVSDRPYKKAYEHDEAVDIIKKDSGVYFDPSLVELFLDVADGFHEITIKHKNAGKPEDNFER
jgi:putative two-component system response regulator